MILWSVLVIGAALLMILGGLIENWVRRTGPALPVTRVERGGLGGRHREPPLVSPPRLSDPPDMRGVYPGGPTPEGVPPIPALFRRPNGVQQETIRNTTVHYPAHYGGITQIDGRTVLVDGHGNAIDIAGNIINLRVRRILQTDRKLTGSQLDDMLLAWHRATDDGGRDDREHG